MPITLTVEDGSGVANANTYVDIAYVDQYALDLGHSVWAGEDDTKAAAILRGMVYIEGFDFKGKKSDRDQSLKWPRIEVTDEDDYLLESTAIPENLKKAVGEAAYRELESPGVLLVDKSPGIKRKKVAYDIETEYFPGGSSGATSFTVIERLLAGLIYSVSSIQVTRA